MMRFSLLAVSAVAIAAATLAMPSCTSGTVNAGRATGPSNDLVALPDGSTMSPATGSTARAIAEWLAMSREPSADFSFGGFAEDRPVLTSEGIGLGADLATMMRASPYATLELAGDEAQARALADLLEGRGVSAERLEVVPAAGIGTVMLTFYRGSTVPLSTAS